MKIFILTFTDVQTNEKRVEVYPTMKLAQIYMKGKRDDAIAESNNLDLIVDENDYGCYIKDVCEITIDEVEMSLHDFIAHKIVEHYCEKVVEASLYYDVIYNIVSDYNTEEYPNIDNDDDVARFINHKLLNTMAYTAAKRLTKDVGLSYEKFNKVVSYLHNYVGICHLAKIINGEMITQYQIKYDIDHPKEPLFKHKKVWAFSSKWLGGGNFSPSFAFRLFEKYEDAADALIDEKKKVYNDFRLVYDEDAICETSIEDANSTEYTIFDKKTSDDVWKGKVEVRYIE